MSGIVDRTPNPFNKGECGNKSTAILCLWFTWWTAKNTKKACENKRKSRKSTFLCKFTGGVHYTWCGHRKRINRWEKKGCRRANQPPILSLTSPKKRKENSDWALANCTQWMRGYDLSSNAILMRLLVLLAIGLGTNNAVTVPRKNTAVAAAFQRLRFLINKHSYKYTNCAVSWFFICNFSVRMKQYSWS